MSIKLNISGHIGQLAIEVIGYENLNAQNKSDANWLKCRIEINVQPFSGKFEASFTTYDFAQFHKELSTTLSDLKEVASFLTDEDTLQLKIKPESTGNIQISGVTQIFGVVQTKLSFSFESDQSFLYQTYQQLEAIVIQFPVKT